MRAQITLCIIAGNVSQYIERFLRSFAPLVSRVVIVHAIGERSRDETADIAAKTCRELGVDLFDAAYANERRGWSHVDDFAAARNLAFSHAETDWIAWADTDDVIDPRSIELIHAAIRDHGEKVDAFAFEYEVPEDGLIVLKERIIRRGSGSWRYPIHEEFAFNSESPRIGRIPGARIVHAPIGPRTVNDLRNVRILESMGEKMPLGHRFHLANSLRAVGRTADAAKEIMRLLQEPALGRPERFELLMSASQMAEGDQAKVGQLLIQAVATDPSRREGPAELIIHSLKQGQFDQALHWARIMDAIPRPQEYMWNARAKYHGWCGVMLHATALRATGDLPGADARELNHFLKHGARISLLHATRGRPKQAYAAKMQWLDYAADPDSIEHIFALDADDPTVPPLSMQRHVAVPGGGGCVAAWNAAAGASSGQVLIQLSDDWVPPRHWDRLILERLGDLSKPSVLAISDGHRTDDLLCMAILTRARYQQQGFMFHPEFKSVYSDNWFTHCAARDGVIVEARDLVFEHRHPAFDAAVPMDQTYAESNAQTRYAEGEATFRKLCAQERS